MMNDSIDWVNHPPHYTGHPKGFECIDVIEDNPFYNIAAAMKYLWRVSWGSKFNDLEDLEKAVWYVQREITCRRNMQTPEQASPLLPPFMQEAMAEMLSRPSPIVHVSTEDYWAKEEPPEEDESPKKEPLWCQQNGCDCGS